MRNFVIVVILCLAGWWGYSNWWVDAKGAEGSGDSSTEVIAAGEGPDAEEGASSGSAEPAGHRPINEAEGEARRLLQALRALDYSGVKVDAALQSRLIGDPAGTYALEVGLALGRPDGPSADLVQAANAVMANGESDGVSDGPALLCAGLMTLVRKKRPGAALEALGTQNGFLMTQSARTSEKALQAYLQAMTQEDPEDVALLLSSLVTRMTRGGDVWKGRRFQALNKAVAALYRSLDEVLLSPEGAWRSQYVTIGRGDTLSKISNRFEKKTEVPIAPGLIQLVNGIPNANRIRAGQRLRIPTDRMEIVVSRRSFTMRVYLGDLLLRVYQVGIGKKGHETPVGSFRVVEKQLDPVWYHPDGGIIPAKDPRNLLGHYFIKLDHKTFKGFGIHGTPRQETVGRRSSLGCIRIRNLDMDEAFSIIPRKTMVKVEDS